jgi:hypothetical protein
MKSNLLTFTLLIILVPLFFTSCEKVKGKGDVVTETRNTGTFSVIDLAMDATVWFTPAPDYSLKISGQQNILDVVVTQVEGSKLVIKVKNGVVLGKHEPVKVWVTAPAVSKLNISGSGDIFQEDTWTGGDLYLNISGSGNISMDSLNANRLFATISGSGSMKAVAGQCEREELSISGSGGIDLRYVPCEMVYTWTSGSGITYVHAVTLLEVSISGSGDVWYYGEPSVSTHISGSGSVRKL